MALHRTRSAAVIGIDAHPVDVEVDMYAGGSARDFITVGMPDAAVRESRERIKSALMNSGFGYPNKSVTINLAPANLRKEVAAAGGHNVLMIGPPGSGKTMLARRMPGILPPLTFAEALATTQIHSVAGLLGKGAGLMTERPFRAPHHTISDAGLIGGGSGTPRPGEVSLAHNGLLFLDELPEFPRNVLELLRQPLEERSVRLARSNMTLSFPANLTLDRRGESLQVWLLRGLLP